MRVVVENQTDGKVVAPTILLAGCAFVLSACGGAGSSAPVAPSQLPTPVLQTPPPTPAPVNYDTPEYKRSNAASAVGVMDIWKAGYSGQGVSIAVIDSGLADVNDEFSGRISSASQYIGQAGQSYADISGHGTAVAAIAAAARNSNEIVGIAPAATVIALRADGGTCADECGFSDTDLSKAVDVAVGAGARVINLSLGGSTANSALRQSFSKAAAAGVVLIVSAGNDEGSEVDPLALAALASAGSKNSLIVGGVDADGQLGDYSNKAGKAAANYVVALGTGVRSFDHTGEAYLFTGTSFAAPAVSGAVALLAQAFPTLTGAQIVELILSSTDDLGAVGQDAVYGRGRLNIGRAFAPSGPTQLAGSAVPIMMGAVGQLGAAFGDGLSNSAGLRTQAVDRFGRTYAADLGAGLRAANAGRLYSRLQAQQSVAVGQAFKAAGLNGHFQFRADQRALNAVSDPILARDWSVSHLGLAHRGVDRMAGEYRPIQEARLAISGPAGVGFVMASGRLAGESLPAADLNAGMMARDALGAELGHAKGTHLVMADYQFGNWHLAAGGSSRTAGELDLQGLAKTATQNRVIMGASWQHDGWQLGFNFQDVQEHGQMLGSRLGQSFGLAGARSQWAGASLAYHLSGFGVRLAGTVGRIAPDFGMTGVLRADGALRGQGWSVAAHREVGAAHGYVRVSAPLAIRAGNLRLANGQYVGVAVRSQEHVGEIGLKWGPVVGAVYHRQHAGHQQSLTDSGGAVTFQMGF